MVTSYMKTMSQYTFQYTFKKWHPHAIFHRSLAAFTRSKATSQRGASLIEHVLLIACVAMVSFVALASVGEQIKAPFDGTRSVLSGGGEICIPLERDDCR